MQPTTFVRRFSKVDISGMTIGSFPCVISSILFFVCVFVASCTFVFFLIYNPRYVIADVTS